jgi:hypothetical protein
MRRSTRVALLGVVALLAPTAAVGADGNNDTVRVKASDQAAVRAAPSG